MRKVATLLVGLLFLVMLSNCTTTQGNATYQGAGLGAAIGAATGAIIDDDNRWRGAAIGALIGGVAGGAITEISKKASAQAYNAPTGQTVVIREAESNTVVQASPVSDKYYNPNARTECRKIHKRIIENGRVMKDVIEEVCESTKTENKY